MKREPEDFSPVQLKEAFDALRADDDATPVPSRVEKRVMGEWDLRAAQRKRRSATLAWSAAIAASLIAAILLSRPHIATVVDLPSAETDIVPREVAPRSYFADVAMDDDRASMQYVQVRMPQSALADLGLPIADPTDAQPMVVEVLVGLDGVPRGLRVLSEEMP